PPDHDPDAGPQPTVKPGLTGVVTTHPNSITSPPDPREGSFFTAIDRAMFSAAEAVDELFTGRKLAPASEPRSTAAWIMWRSWRSRARSRARAAEPMSATI